MRIVHVINSAEVGGGGEHLIKLTRGLKLRGCVSTVVVGRDGLVSTRLRLDGVRVHVLGEMGLRTLRPLMHLLRIQRPEVLHLHGSRAGLLGALSARAAGVQPVIYTAHAFAFRRADYPILHPAFVLAERTTCALVDRVICLTHSDVAEAAEARISTAHVTVIPNGIDAARFEVVGDRSALGIPEGVAVIGMVARLVPQKDPMTFLHAAKLVTDTIPDARFLLIGDGPLRPMIARATCELGLEGQCLLLGTRHDVPQLLALMDVVLLTSRWEGLPLAALEAMAAARPLVASQLPGLSEVIDDGLTGVLVSPGDSAQFAAAAVALLRDAPRRVAMGARARRRAVDDFSLERMVTSTVDAYHAALAACGSTVEVRTT